MKTIALLYFADTYQGLRPLRTHTRMPAGIRGYGVNCRDSCGEAIRGYCIKRGVAKPLRKVYQTKGYGLATIPLDRIKRGVAL